MTDQTVARPVALVTGASGGIGEALARGAPFAPRPVLLSMVERLQKKRSGTHG